MQTGPSSFFVLSFTLCRNLYVGLLYPYPLSYPPDSFGSSLFKVQVVERQEPPHLHAPFTGLVFCFAQASRRDWLLSTPAASGRVLCRTAVSDRNSSERQNLPYASPQFHVLPLHFAATRHSGSKDGFLFSFISLVVAKIGLLGAEAAYI